MRHSPPAPLLAIVTAIAMAMAMAWAGVAWPQDQTGYVTDQLEVTLRRGTGTQFGIVRMLPAGTVVEILEVDADSGYSRVRTEQGIEGWLLSRYLMSEPAARSQLADLRRRLDQALAQRGSAGEMLDTMTAQRDQLAGERDQLARDAANLRRELEELRQAAAEPLQLRERNVALGERVQILERELSEARAEVAGLRRNTQRDWFVAGAAVLLLGLVLGLVLPRIRWRRRSRWGEL